MRPLKNFFLKKIIIFDLDGTLVRSKSNLDKEMARLLRQLLERKKMAVISGGDFHQFQKQFLNRLKGAVRQLKNLLILPTSGGELRRYQNNKWKLVYKYFLSPSEKKRIFAAFEKVFRDSKYVQPKKTFGKIIEDRKTQITFSALGQRAPLIKKEIWNKKRDVRKRLKIALKKILPEFEIRLGGLTSIDILKKGIDKAYGISQIKKLLKMKKKDLLYIGDAFHKDGNDYIVKKTGISILTVKNEKETKKLLNLELRN